MTHHGIADRLFGLGKAKARSALRDLPELPESLQRMDPGDRQAVDRTREAAKRAKAALALEDGSLSSVAVEVGGEVDRLVELVQELAGRLGRARSWLRQHDPDRLGREAAELELERELSGAMGALRGRSEAALGEQVEQAERVRAGVPLLALRLQTAARELEALAARVTADSLSATGGAQGLLDGLRAQQERAQRALKSWAAAVGELRGL